MKSRPPRKKEEYASNNISEGERQSRYSNYGRGANHRPKHNERDGCGLLERQVSFTNIR